MGIQGVLTKRRKQADFRLRSQALVGALTLVVDLLIGENGALAVVAVGNLHAVRLTVVNTAVNGDDRFLAAVQDDGCPIAGLGRQTPEACNAVVAVMLNLNVAGVHTEPIGVCAGLAGHIHGIAVHGKYRM